ncbi:MULTISPECIES: hypothetical protein [Sulfolobaceae]|uniref:hypothetical protein n=1 Tax=Sulfolobaceae TaxID=118883 RepID=UPI000AC14514|nr:MULTISPECIES: hypothetical protein [unclassified Sulfolobus]
MTTLVLKHRYGNYGLLAYIDLAFILSVALVASYNFLFPQVRDVVTSQQFQILSLEIWTIGIILSVITVKNISLGLGQDLFDGTIVTFLQIKNKRTVFFILYTLDVLAISLLFITISEITFLLSSFRPPLIWIEEFISQYLFICNLSYLITLLIKRPFRSFFISIFIILSLLGAEVVGLAYIFYYFLPVDFLLIYFSYHIFKRMSI